MRSLGEAEFEQLVLRHHRSIVRLARSIVRSEALAEEVAQDTWEAVVTGIHRFEGRSSLRAWIFGIALNKARRRAGRERGCAPFSAFQGGASAAVVDRFRRDGRWAVPPRPWNDPDVRLGSLELREALRVGLERLPERQRLVVALRDVEGFSPEEVQRLLGLSAANERVLLHRGRSALRTAIEALLDPAARAA